MQLLSVKVNTLIVKCLDTEKLRLLAFKCLKELKVKRVANIKIPCLVYITGDKLVGEVSRLVVAEACIQALDIEFTQGKAFEINSVKVSHTVFLKVRTLKYRINWKWNNCTV